MKILVLGGSGGVGRHVVRLAAEAGHEVTAVVRPATAFMAPAGVRVSKGQLLAPGVLDVVQGHDVVISSLGIQRANPANPWSRVTSPPDFCSASARLLTEAMKRHGCERVIAVSAAGVADSAAGMPAWMRWFLASSNIRVAYRDLAAMERVYADSGVDWLCPRPTRLTDGPITSRVKVVDAFAMTAAISRADVAAWMLARATDAAAWSSLPSRTPQISVT